MLLFDGEAFTHIHIECMAVFFHVSMAQMVKPIDFPIVNGFIVFGGELTPMDSHKCN